MRKELRDYIVNKYPKLFKQTKTLAVGDGWYWLIENLCAYIQMYVDGNKVPQVEIACVKQKFGGLRCYIENGGTELQAITWFVCSLSLGICEDCGSVKDIQQTKSMYVETLCKKCRIKLKEQESSS